MPKSKNFAMSVIVWRKSMKGSTKRVWRCMCHDIDLQPSAGILNTVKARIFRCLGPVSNQKEILGKQGATVAGRGHIWRLYNQTSFFEKPTSSADHLHQPPSWPTSID